MDITNPIFTDADKAREHLEALRWPSGPICPRCGVVGNSKKLEGKSTRPGVYKCRDCRKPFSVTVGTVFERSKIPLNKWLLATHLLSSSKKGMSAHQLHRMLDVTYKTAWFMAHRIRESMRDNNNGTDIVGGGGLGGKNKVVEADETYVGGKSKNRAFKTLRRKRPLLRLLSVAATCVHSTSLTSLPRLSSPFCSLRSTARCTS